MKKLKRKKPKFIGYSGLLKAKVYTDELGAKFIYVHAYGKKKRIRDYTKF